MTIVRDDRTPEQRQTHKMGVVCRDKFMSGWGGAQNGYSRALWACAPDADLNKLLSWVRSRKEMIFVNVVQDVNKYRPSRGTAHLHIYVCGPQHPSQA